MQCVALLSYASGTNKIGHTSSLNLTKTPLGDVNKGNFIIYDNFLTLLDDRKRKS